MMMIMITSIEKMSRLGLQYFRAYQGNRTSPIFENCPFVPNWQVLVYELPKMRCWNKISGCTMFVGKELVEKWRKCSGKRRHRVEVANYRKPTIVLKQTCNGQKFIDIEQRSKVLNVWNWIKVSHCQNLRVLDHFTAFALSWGPRAVQGVGEEDRLNIE